MSALAVPAWLAPTARATPWWPLAAVSTCLALAAVPVALGAAWPAGVLGVVAASLAAATVAGLGDPAEALLAAVPRSPAVRRVQRLVLLVPVATAAWVAWLGLGRVADAAAGWPGTGLLALALAGLAVAVWAPTHLGVAAGAAVPLVWVVTARVAGHAWDAHATTVALVAAAALWLGRNR